jgi:Leucine-rich repeat (LRR) protein
MISVLYTPLSFECIDQIMRGINKRLLFVFLCSYCFISKAQIPEDEKNALLSLFTATNGGSWNVQWNISEPVENWHGVKIRDNHVVSIELGRNNLTGCLPKEIAAFKRLEVLNLALNNLRGNFPNEVLNLLELKEISLEMNNFKNQIPDEFSGLKNLEVLSLYNNAFIGSIPGSLGEIKKLRIINLSGNYLEGTIPLSFEELSNLEVLGLFGNKLSGVITLDFHKLLKLYELTLAYNKFIGAVPVGIEDLGDLKYLQLQGNNFNSFESLKNLNKDRLITLNTDSVGLQKGAELLDIEVEPMVNSKLEELKVE